MSDNPLRVLYDSKEDINRRISVAKNLLLNNQINLDTIIIWLTNLICTNEYIENNSDLWVFLYDCVNNIDDNDKVYTFTFRPEKTLLKSFESERCRDVTLKALILI